MNDENTKVESHVSIRDLDITCSQSVVDLMLAVQCGDVSCRRAAREIVDAVDDKIQTATHTNDWRYCDGCGLELLGFTTCQGCGYNHGERWQLNNNSGPRLSRLN